MQPKEQVSREWYLIDAQDQVLGKVAVEIAKLLIGKHKPTYTPHIDGGDYVVVVNARHVALSKGKEHKKVYRWHTNYPGSLKELSFEEMRTRHPEKIIIKAVKNMLPKNKLQKKRLARLKVYADEQHQHQSQLASK